MMRLGHVKKGVLALLGIAIALGMGGCPPPAQITVTVVPAYAVVGVGQTIELFAESTSAADTAFTWTSSNEAVARVEVAKSTAVILRAIRSGTATIRATGNVSGAVGKAVISVPTEPGGGEGEGEGEGEVVAPEIPALAPGLNITIKSVNIPADLRPVVHFEATDNLGKPLILAEFTDLRFVLAYLNDHPVSPHYTSYIVNNVMQATFDAARINGVTKNPDGSFTYRFQSALPAGYNPAATHQLAGQFQRRHLVTNTVYNANAVSAFRPDGQPVTQTREISTTAVCNSCHTRLSLHGTRREFQYCIVCHNPQSVDPDTGNTVDMAVMVHKIHMGENLPSVQQGTPYRLIGFQNSVHDYSTVRFPQDVRNCTTCHRDAPHADAYLTRPTRAACGSCHDRIWFGNPWATPAGYHNHPFDFEQPNDSLCSTCHRPAAPAVSPILESHGIEANKGPGLALDIVSVFADMAEDGLAISIQFSAADGNGVPVSDLAGFNAEVGAILAWPVPEFQFNVAETFVGAGPASPRLFNLGDGLYRYTFGAPAPGGGVTYAVALQGRVRFMIGAAQYQQGTMTNGYTVFTVDGSEPVHRRQVVDEHRCNQCHGEVRAHGTRRVGVAVCLMCHHTHQADLAGRDNSTPLRQVADAVTVNFKDMIHRIHTGENLTMPYTVIGSRGTVYDFTHVRFPGDRRQCTICHFEGTYGVPVADEALPTVIDNTITVTQILPERAACTSCHDHPLSNIHAILMSDTENGVESCAVCHGQGRARAVQTIHNLGP